jgi:hypothetical protein
MRITIIPSDGFMAVNGVGYSGVDLSSVPAGIRAVQFDGAKGEIERPGDADTPPTNEAITDVGQFAGAMAAWAAKHAEATAEPAPVPELTPDQIRKERFTQRSQAKDGLIIWMADTNVARIESGEWTSADLVGLTQDAEMKSLLEDIQTLSFELALRKIPALTNPLMTEAIKAQWVGKLTESLYLSSPVAQV